MKITFEELLGAIQGTVLVEGVNKEFNELSIDTRTIKEGNVFLAIKGESFNGNKYIKQAFQNGATIAIVDEFDFSKEDIDGTVIKVENGEKALQDLAHFYRMKLGIKVVGVTGSTGKTSTKDLIAAVLSDKYKVFKTKGNFNNQIGLPLMILELTEEDEVAVLEMGMSDFNEIHLLASIARPDVSVITNIGLSHIETLKTRDNIFKAKMEISDFLTDTDTLIVNGEDDYLKNVTKKCFNVEKIGYNQEYDVSAKNIILNERETKFTASVSGNEFQIEIPMPGKHNVLNCMLAIAVANKLSVSSKEIVKGMANLEATSMRLQLIEKEDILIINDCYNASPDSMKSSLDVLNNYQKGRKVAILGTMKELGTESETAHEAVGRYAKDKVDFLMVAGEYTDCFKKGYADKNILVYETMEELKEKLADVIQKDDIILVKASRGMKFENIVQQLEKLTI